MNAKQIKLLRAGCLLAVLLGAPVLVGAMDHSSMAGMDHSSMAGMGASEQMIMLGDNVQDGVKGSAHLTDISKAMSGMGMKATHHFMVMFTEEKGGKGIGGGAAAVKVTDPAGVTGEAGSMMAMGDGFGADLTLAKPGKYSFEVGTKLADGKKRQFRFGYVVK